MKAKHFRSASFIIKKYFYRYYQDHCSSANRWLPPYPLPPNTPWLVLVLKQKRVKEEKWKIILSNAKLPNIDSIKIAWEKLCFWGRRGGSITITSSASFIGFVEHEKTREYFHPVYLFYQMWKCHQFRCALCRRLTSLLGLTNSSFVISLGGRYQSSIENSFGAVSFYWSENWKANADRERIISRLFIMPIWASAHWFHNEQDIWINKLIFETMRNVRASSALALAFSMTFSRKHFDTNKFLTAYPGNWLMCARWFLLVWKC